MNRTRLHLEQRTDKNGHIVKRWVASPESPKTGGGGRSIQQSYTSAGTSLKNNYPSVFKDKRFTEALVKGNRNFDIGAGRTDIPTQILMSSYGVSNIPFDPFNRDKDVNRQAVESLSAGKLYPTVTVANVLNVIDNPDSRSNVILQAAKALAPDGKAFFQIHNAGNEGGKTTGKDTYQTSMKPTEYVEEIKIWFDEVKAHGNIIIASKPKDIISEVKAEWWLSDPASGGEIMLKSIQGDDKLEYFKKLIMDHLDAIEKGTLTKGGKAMPVGTVRDWKGVKHIKLVSGKWRPQYDKETRGAKMAIAAIKRKVSAAQDARELLQIVLEHSDRFRDKNGYPLPFVQELSKYVDEKGSAIERSAAPKMPKKDMHGRTLTHNIATTSSGTMATLMRPLVDKKEITYTEVDRIVNALLEYAEKNQDKYEPNDLENVWNDFTAENDIRKIATQGGDDTPPAEKKEQPASEAPKPKIESSGKTILGYTEQSFLDWQRKKGRPVAAGELSEGEERELQAFIKQHNKNVADKKAEKPRISIEDLNAGWPQGLYTMQEVADSLKNGDVFRGWPAWVWQNGARNEQSYREAKITGKELTARQEKLFSDENKVGDAKPKPIDRDKMAEIKADFEGGKIGYDEAKRRLREEANLPKTMSTTWLITDAQKKKNQAMLDRRNSDKGFLSTLPKAQQKRAEDWIGNKKYSFKGKTLSVSEYVNQQFAAGTLKLDPAPLEDGGGVNGLNIGKYGRLYAEYLLKDNGKTSPEKKTGGEKRNPGDRYIDESEGKFSVRTAREDGNDSYAASGGMLGGPIQFDTREAAQEWIDKNPVKAREKKGLPRRNMDFIDRNKDGEVKGKYLYEKETGGRIELTGANLEYYNLVRGTDEKPEEKNKREFGKIQEKYKAAKIIDGDTDEVQIGKEAVSGKWRLVEADTPTASHDEMTFQKTPGFPTNADGSSINDRDYEHFQANKEAVLNVGSDFDGRALKFDNPVIVTTDGIVISGNNRTMSSKIAARKGTDKNYIEALKKRAKKFGFTEEQVGQFKNPRVVFEIEQQGGYSTSQFAKYNESGKKEMGPTEKAAKVSKMITPDTIEAVAKKIDEFETIGELYQDVNASRHIYHTFKEAGLIGENEAGRYFENGILTDDGKTFIETALLGTVINETNLRGFNRPGCKSIRGTLLRALIPLVENKGMNGYSINRELNEAVDIAMQVAINKDQFKNIGEFAKQRSMFETIDPVAVELAKRMEGTQKAFAEFMKTMNGGLKSAANGEVDIFLGGVESKEEILNRMLKPSVINKAIIGALKLLSAPAALRKSLTFSGHELQGRETVQGMKVSIENKKGSTRSGTDKDGHVWHTKMHYDYGYIRGTVGVDKDHLDAYVGPYPESSRVFIVNQNDPVTGDFDEQKVMLGFNESSEAKAAYLKQYDRPGFFGSIIEMDIDTFKETAFDDGNKGKPLAAVEAVLNKSIDKTEYYCKLLIEHLDNTVTILEKGGKGLPVGTIREWNGKKHQKRGPGDWVPVSGGKAGSKEEGSKKTGAAQDGTSAVKGKIKDGKKKGPEQIMQIILENKEQFSDDQGEPLPVVMEIKRQIETNREKAASGEKGGPAGGDGGKTGSEKQPDNKDASKEGGPENNGAPKKTYIPPESFNAAEWSKQWQDEKATANDAGKEYILSSFGGDSDSIANAIRDADSKNQRIIDDDQQTDKLHRRSGEGESARYSPEREKIHGAIMQELLSPDKIRTAIPPAGQKPKFIMLGGRGGSGKSWFKNNIYDPNTCVVLDADEIKAKLPEFKGWNANQVHEESSDILEQMLAVCIRNGLNVVLDATMKTADKALGKVYRFKSAGYKTEAHYMHLPKQEAAKRAIHRFKGEPEKGKEDEHVPFSGRYVPVTTVLQNTTNEDSFDVIRSVVDEWSFRDNNVKRGELPILISEGRSKK
jgi:predicted kinase